MRTHLAVFMTIQLMLLSISACHAFAQGSLNPTADAVDQNGDPVANMKTMNQVEPRTLIPSVPYFITNSGSYYLAGNLVYTNAEATNGITIAADDVRIDLGGFTLSTTSNSVSQNGIWVAYVDIDPWKRFNITIRNGVIRGWGSDGINTQQADDSQISDMKVLGNGAYGMLVGPNSLVERCSIRESGSCGLEISDGGTVTDCKVSDGGKTGPFYEGIYASGTKITGCTANGNKIGIWVNGYCTVRDCTVLWNEQHGIRVGDSCRIEDNNCSQNAYGGTNDGAGILVQGSGNRIEANNVTDNMWGIKVDNYVGGNLIVRNSANGNDGYSYQTSGSDYYGTVLDTGDMGTTGFAGDPWSNFEF